MLSEKQRNYLRDILHHIDAAQRFTQGYSYETFVKDERTFLAVVRCFEIISEASRRLPDPFKTAHSEIQWQQMAAAGNVYRHGYSGVTPLRVWETLKEALPPLRELVEAELASGNSSP
ncbi:MAG: DUF86 domain-containing protein [Pseudolabrys sp.]|nr:DUF86 domain-containing protein [Pseudolabrys sp.]